MKRALVIAMALAPSVAWAHKPSDAHLQLAVSGDQLAGTLAVALRDLDGALDLDADGDGEITWGEVLSASQRIDTYAHERVAVTGCTFAFGTGKLVDFSDGAYWAMPLTGSCASAPSTLVVHYALLFDIDAQHRGIVHVETARGSRTIVVRDAKPIAIALATDSMSTSLAQGFVRVWSPAELALLGCLILPVVLLRRGRPRDVARGVTAIFVAFAVASCATLLVAAAELVYLPPQLVDAALVIAIVAAAASNLLRSVASRWELAFELGLVQGLGAALWLRDAGLATHRLAPTLGFAAGIAIAQAAFVAVLVPALFLIRRTFADRALLWVGSAATGLAAIAFWIA